LVPRLAATYPHVHERNAPCRNCGDRGSRFDVRRDQRALGSDTCSYAGELEYVDTVHNGKGPVRIIDLGGQRFVRFEDVAITNAPDIHVYLSRESGGKWSESASLYLGALKATNGSFNYEIPAGITVGDYKSVVVWCRAFGVLITWADLA